MQRRDRQSCGANYAAQIERLGHLKSYKIWTLADIRAALTNQELALAVMWLRAEAENPKKTMEDKFIVVVCGYPELRTFTKTGINFATRLELPGRSPSHDANSRLLCSEFHVRMKRVNSNVQASNYARFICVWCERTLSMVVLPWELGRSVMKSTAIWDQGHWGIGNGWRRPAGSFREVLDVSHSVQLFTNVTATRTDS